MDAALLPEQEAAFALEQVVLGEPEAQNQLQQAVLIKQLAAG